LKTVKHLLAGAWLVLGPRSGGIAAPILCYHTINDAPDVQYDPMPAARFESHLKHLSANYNVIGMDALADGLDGGRLPPKPVVITFDDGYRDNYEVAFPLLRRYRTPATIYLVTSFVDGAIRLIPDPVWDAMRWDQAREMADSGLIAFGAHGRSHRILSDLDNVQLRDEILGSKQDIESKLGRPVTSFAYPNGQGTDIPPAAVAAVREAGFTSACATFWRTSNTASQRFVLNRVMMTRDDDVGVLEQKLRGAYDYIYALHKAKAYVSVKFRGRGVWR